MKPRDFRRWLKVERRAAASTVNLAPASLDAVYRQRGLAETRKHLEIEALEAALQNVDWSIENR